MDYSEIEARLDAPFFPSSYLNQKSHRAPSKDAFRGSPSAEESVHQGSLPTRSSASSHSGEQTFDEKTLVKSPDSVSSPDNESQNYAHRVSFPSKSDAIDSRHQRYIKSKPTIYMLLITPNVLQHYFVMFF